MTISLLARLLTKAHLELEEVDEQLCQLVPGTQMFNILKERMLRTQDRIDRLAEARLAEAQREAA